ncbi:M23 family metallopeptidase [Streptosporangium sp. NPDC049644]|uniref:M23 family metallopeptidase n=1 Tax=Streptosporangium sp. NPDC049644 TaxID=3155507 RepID=UPI00341FA86D
MVAALIVLTGGTATPPAHAAAAPAFQTPFPCGMAVDLTTGPTHDRARGKLLDMYRAPWSNSQIQSGTPIMAAAGGVVTASHFESGAGHLIKINHGDNYYTFYMHLKTRNVTVGQQVTAGQQIGELGNSGTNSGGAFHLHYEVFRDTNGDGSGAVSELIYPAFNGVEYHLSEGGNSYTATTTSRNCGATPNLGVLDFYLSDNLTSGAHTQPVVSYGNSPMIPISGDWDGDGKDTPSAYDPTTGRFLLSNNPTTGAAQHIITYGNPNADPLVGDWDGDGKDNIGVRMGYTFCLRTSPITTPTETTQTIAYGDAPMRPLIGDWDGDGKDTPSAYDPTTGRFLLSNNPTTGAAQHIITYGNPNADPLVGDWDGDGKDNIGVRMGNAFSFRTSPITTPTETTQSISYGDGSPHDLPITGDWNGDGKDTHGIVR